MYFIKSPNVLFIGFKESCWFSSGLCMGEIFNGNQSNRDDIPFPYQLDGTISEGYIKFCENHQVDNPSNP